VGGGETELENKKGLGYGLEFNRGGGGDGVRE